MRNIIRFSMLITFLSFLVVTYWKPQDFLMVVAIMSSPENFQAREMIRNTWLRNINPHLIKTFFFLGDSICDTPPSDRDDYYSCERLNLSLKYDDIEDEMNFTTAKINREPRKTKHFIGFIFRNFHKIKLTHLGISSSILRLCTNVKVVLYEATSNQHVVSALFHRSEVSNESTYEIKEVDAYILPKYFEGKIVIETLSPLPRKLPCNIVWDSGHNIVHFNQMIRTPNEMPHIWDEEICPPAFFSFDVEDTDELKVQIGTAPYRSIQYKSYSRNVKLQIFQEAAKYNDIVFIDLLDIYRNLPNKLLRAIKWAIKNIHFKYLLKTDDDVFINIHRIVNEVHALDGARAGWWGAFREGWPVHVTGKWRELHYRAPHYPPFPCGATYVLNWRLVDYLANNQHLFLDYQGEDVSMGIWASSINPHRYQGTYDWVCDKSCRKDSYNRPEITPYLMNESYHNLQRCGNMCGCEGSSYVAMENKWM